MLDMTLEQIIADDAVRKAYARTRSQRCFDCTVGKPEKFRICATWSRRRAFSV
jgi:hypothetical protein